MKAAVSDSTRGILLLVGAASSFSCIDALARMIGNDIGIIQVTWARYMFFLPLVVFVARPVDWPRLLRTQHLRLQIVRAILPMISGSLMVIGVRFMPLAEATTLLLTAPIFLTVLSVPLLGEHVGWHRWLAVLFGFAGVLVVIQPGSGLFGLAALAPLGGAVLLALYQATTRMLGRETDPAQTVLYTALVGTVVASVAVVFVWQSPTPAQWGMLVASGFFHGLGQILLIRAYTLAEASTLSPFNYAGIIAGTILGYALFQEFPAPTTLVGIAIIVGVGLYVFHRERRSHGA